MDHYGKCFLSLIKAYLITADTIDVTALVCIISIG